MVRLFFSPRRRHVGYVPVHYVDAVRVPSDVGCVPVHYVDVVRVPSDVGCVLVRHVDRGGVCGQHIHCERRENSLRGKGGGL